MPIGNGGIIGPANVPTLTTASGVWSLREQQQAQGRGAWPLALTQDPYFEYTTLLLPGNGTNGQNNNAFLDGSTNNFTITRNGNTTQGTFSPFSQTGWGNYFDGSGDYLSAGSNSAFAFGTGAYTVELWVYPLSISQQVYVVNDTTNGSVFYFETTGSAGFTISPRSGSPLVTGGYSSLITNSWNHVVFVRGSTAANQTSIFVNSTRVANGTDSTNWTITGPCLIGGLTNNTYMLSGYLSNTRIVKGSAVYDPTQTSITVPTAPLTAISGTSLLTCQSNRFIDNSTNNFTITRNGDTRVVAFSPFNPTLPWSAATNGGSGYFDGSGDYLTTPDNVAFTVGSGNWTLEAWVYPTASPNQPIIFGQWSGGTDGSVAMMLSNDGNRYLRGLVYSGGVVDRISGSSLQLNAWNHCAFVREGTFLNLYLNGSRVDNYSFGSGSVQDSLLVVSAGAASSGTQPFQGYICDCRFLKGTAQYTGATYTVPTAPLTAITNTSLLLNYTNAGIYDATSKNDLETVGNAQISNAITPKWGSTSIKFDGNGDYLTGPASTELDMGTGNWTIEGWVNITTRTLNYPSIISNNNGSFSTGALSFQVSNADTASYLNKFVLSVFGVGNIVSSVTNSTGVWYHFAAVRNGTNLSIYRDGTSVASTTISSGQTFNWGKLGLRVGGGNWDGAQSYLDGYLQDLRITKGYARYTANFTPPTAAFPTL